MDCKRVVIMNQIDKMLIFVSLLILIIFALYGYLLFITALELGA